MLKKNEECIIEITDLNNLGFGVGRVDGMVVFVSGAVDGDTVRAHILRVTAGYAVAKAVEILSPSPYRAESPCTASGCGGCAYRGVTREHEIALKENAVRHAFIKNGLPDVKILPLLETGERYGYRKSGALYATERNSDAVIALFCHFGIAMNMLSCLLRIPFHLLLHGFIMAPSSVTTLVTEERVPGEVWFRCAALGDTSHLYAAGEPVSHYGRFHERYGVDEPGAED